MKKWFVLLLILSIIFFTLSGCTLPDGAEGEGEGEGEPEENKQVVLVELYLQEGCGYCKIVEPILEQLATEYSREELILLEKAVYGIHSTDEIRERYKWYFSNAADRGTPNILFNGLQDRIYQQTSLYTYGVIKNKIEAQLSSTPTIQLQASRATDSEGTVITGKVKNITESALTNVVVNGMAFKDRGKQGFRYSVTDIFEDEKESISSLAAGEEVSFTITIDGLNWDAENLDGVIFVQSVDHPKKVIRQSLFLD